MLSVLRLLSYLAGAGGFLFVLLSLASGLLYVAEVIDEHSAAAKQIGQRIIYVLLVLLVALHFLDGLPLYLTSLCFACHLLYLQNFSKTWPSISLTSITFISSCTMVVVCHFVCFNYFSERARDSRGYGRFGRDWKHSMHSNRKWLNVSEEETFMDVATFFCVFVWLVPMGLFLSLSANDNALPSAGSLSTSQSSSRPSSPTIHRKKQSSIIKTAFSIIPLFSRSREDTIIASTRRSGPPSGTYSPSLVPVRGGMSPTMENPVWSSSNRWPVNNHSNGNGSPAPGSPSATFSSGNYSPGAKHSGKFSTNPSYSPGNYSPTLSNSPSQSHGFSHSPMNSQSIPEIRHPKLPRRHTEDLSAQADSFKHINLGASLGPHSPPSKLTGSPKQNRWDAVEAQVGGMRSAAQGGLNRRKM